MRLLYIADNGFSCRDGKYYCTTPNIVNINQYNKYFDKVHIIARESQFQDNVHEINGDTIVILIKKNDFLALFKAMKSIRKEYDIVLMRNGINGCFAGFFARVLSIPTIAYCGADPYEFQKSGRGFVRRYIVAPIWRFLEQQKMKKADYAQYCTPYLYKKYPTRHQHLICSNVDITVNEKDFMNRVDKINANSDKVVIGMIGRLDENKGLDTILHALTRLGPQYCFEFVGGGDTRRYSIKAKELGVLEQVHFLGYCTNRKQMMEWLAGIDVYIQPSLSEGLPRSTIEAMSMACPCIATNIAGLPDLLEEEYLIYPKDDEALAEKIKWLSNNKEDAIKAARTNFNKAREFDRNVRDEKLDAFYGGIVNAAYKTGDN